MLFRSQDANTIRLTDCGFFAAVGDGAGSAESADEGSTAAVAAAIDCLAAEWASHPPETEEDCRRLLGLSLTKARSALIDLTHSNPSSGGGGEPRAVALNAFATTLLVAFVDKNWFGTAQLGDGAIVVRDAQGSMRLLAPARSSEYLNETEFLTSQDFLQRALIRVEHASNVRAVAIFSDGVEWAAVRYSDNTPYGPFFDPLFAYAECEEITDKDLADFLESDRFCEQTDDDKTLLLAVRL